MAIDLAFSAEQEHLRQAARDFFQRRCPSSVVREVEEGGLGHLPDLWREMASMGWLGITLPEAHGGAGGTFLDAYPLAEEMGRFLVPGPYLDTVAVAGDVILAAGTDEQRRTILPAIAAGDRIVSLAVVEPDGGFGPGAVTMAAARRGGDVVLDGTKLLVSHASSADHLLVPARTGDDRSGDGTTLFLVDPAARGVTLTALPTIGSGPLHAVSFDGVVVPADSVVGEVDRGWSALGPAVTKAAVLQTGTIVGAAHAVLDMTNQYAKDREQFGNPIGRYQAVQYLVTDVLIDLHRADLLARQAAYLIDAGKPFAREAAIAIAFGKDAAAHLHRQAHEVHAGVAFILDHDLQLYSRRSKYWENNLGDARYHREQVVRELQLA